MSRSIDVDSDVYRVRIRAAFHSGVEQDSCLGPYGSLSAARGERSKAQDRYFNYGGVKSYKITVEKTLAQWEEVSD